MVSGQYMPTNKAKMSLAGSWGRHLLHASLWARVPRSDLNRREIDTKSNEETPDCNPDCSRTLLVQSQGPGVFFHCHHLTTATYDPLNKGFTDSINTGW